jgi:hypothetical protein
VSLAVPQDDDLDISFVAANFALVRIDWVMDDRPSAPDDAYREFKRHLETAFPTAKVRLIVRRYFGDPVGYSLGNVKASFNRVRYLGADALEEEDMVAAERLAAQVIKEKFSPVLRQLLALYRTKEEARDEDR